MRADAQQFRSRISRGMLLIVEDRTSDEIVGFITYFRPRWAEASVFDTLLHDTPDDLIRLPAAERWRRLCQEFDLPLDWDAATDGGSLSDSIHDPDGEIFFAVSITTNPEYSGRGIAAHTLRAARQVARRSGAKYFVGYGRLPNFAESNTLDITEHMDRSREDGGPSDLGLRIHWKAGGQPVRSASGQQVYLPIPNSMPHDTQSRGWGFLVAVPLETPAEEETAR